MNPPATTGSSRARRHADELEFLPAAVEVLETPPSPAGRTLGWALMVLFSLAVLWSVHGRLDTVAVAAGRVVPGGQVKVVQVLEAGTVSRILVRSGDQVRRGQLLVQLDDTDTAADLVRLDRELFDAVLQRARLLAQETGDDIVVSAHEMHGAVAPPALELQRDILLRAREEHASMREELTRRVDEARQAAASMSAQHAKLEAAIPLLAERVQALRALAAARVGARVDYLALAQQLLELEHDRDIAGRRVAELETSAAALEAELRRRIWAHRREIAERRVEADGRVLALTQESRKLGERHARKALRAPVDGVVNELSVTTVGEVLAAGTQVLAVVPHGVALEVEASVHNRDAGFVHPGQAVEVKVESYPFTRYGLLSGQVEHIAADAVAGDDGSFAYPVRIVLAEDALLVDGRHARMVPGMRVSAEIHTGDRRLIEFFMEPLLRYRHEALRER